SRTTMLRFSTFATGSTCSSTARSRSIRRPRTPRYKNSPISSCPNTKRHGRSGLPAARSEAPYVDPAASLALFFPNPPRYTSRDLRSKLGHGAYGIGCQQLTEVRAMAVVEVKTFDKPDETRAFEGNGMAEVVTVAGRTVARGTFEPGWRWSTNIKPL